MIKPPPEASQCQSNHDVPTLLLSLLLCTGLIISYLPQHIRIISAKSSEGFSPWYLLLGATSSASGMLNILIMQWPLFRCCRILSAGSCFESLLGFLQVTLQWLLFTIILVLYLIYFPKHLKYQRVIPVSSSDSSLAEPNYGAVQDQEDREEEPNKAKVTTTPEWRLAVTLGIVVALHLGLLLLISLALLVYLPPTVPPHPLLRLLATFLGLSATILAVLQYAPQIHKTYKARLVGALSLGTMAIQVPGSVLFVLSLVFRPGTNWTSWLAYAVTGAMQGALLVICLLWKRRQKALGIDDFGKPLVDAEETTARE
ncbi:hypothetical protein J010_04155 [Cryptococcus neoformans]|uniref:PQ loop repeat protein n=1 Tax=Cryptococcus neoformans Tu259-1 TaxID=1230072 RepID=A0A854QB66_CRYNE|nr:hypothetical protein C353_04249 [Cryptococcus neoformans var. grubii AD1-83a]OXG18424.1 hypothetical protein C361_04549 [Cryptococcus neoformans var. grubii Tu259-1]OXG40041.1 hypothetical protein C359_03963 [Cryptococcus neoformans var. grubii Bt120]OXG48913.1 hypothetical protein C355_04054 [Cryptococcus neoformans var. grubii Th84]OXG56322.1 hypothetical protein C354_04184 [Cryptococcus neoformans var. grubii MW-RSA1955]OXG60149.1 hypothetical protein C352_04186 [Cryptococcus neoformans 